MQFLCTATGDVQGQWTLRHESANLGVIEVAAASRQDAIRKMQDELRYRLELCPCSGQSYQYINVEIVEQSAR